ncbi:F0F1 ATP synthase subunit A [Bacteroidales bacterium OttesenSCG-928-B11]|nr:F0F1 ATP synthase subunit A [Bacteroidales bacterium OttesenSCG-928-E04]MDL2312492.1 F0F1 ATP synthase subunit A [Bacteroidales bacterium OttesenSCG-928-B11]MDL2325723.1 F0F1 ATP synthase subunit A [Bacteroidales bacterium OttesenSCG-928-A14]
MNYINKFTRIICVFILSLLLIPSFNSIAATEEKEPFNPGTFIIDHILDSYGWHVITYKDKDISIPLPIILFDDWKPVVFMSGKFHHGHDSYKGYALGFTENTKNRIVKLNGEYAGYSGHITEDMVDHIDSEAKLIDISITKNVCALFISIFLILWMFLSVAKKYKANPCSAPKGLQSILEVLVLFVRDNIAKSAIGPKYEKYLPYLLTLFFFIFINNLLGLLPIFPGGANLTGNIAVTAVLALITFFVTNLSSNKSYWVHIFNTPGVPWWLKIPIPLMPIVELVGVFTKPLVLMIRLFANISAGHIIIMGFICLIFIFGQMAPAIGYGVSVVSVFFYLFMGILELIVAFVQAFVFTLLSALYIGMAIEEHHEEHHENTAIETTNSQH